MKVGDFSYLPSIPGRLDLRLRKWDLKSQRYSEEHSDLQKMLRSSGWHLWIVASGD